MVALAENRAQQADQHQPHARSGVLAGTAADDQRVDVPVIPVGVGAHRQRTHAVAKEHQRKSRPLRAHPEGELVQVLHHALVAVRIEVAQILRAAHRRAVAAMVVDHAQTAARCQKFHEGLVALLVFAHAVGQLHQTAHLALRTHQHHGQRQAVEV